MNRLQPSGFSIAIGVCWSGLLRYRPVYLLKQIRRNQCHGPSIGFGRGSWPVLVSRRYQHLQRFIPKTNTSSTEASSTSQISCSSSAPSSRRTWRPGSYAPTAEPSTLLPAYVPPIASRPWGRWNANTTKKSEQ
jgi:hypothetical protein